MKNIIWHETFSMWKWTFETVQISKNGARIQVCCIMKTIAHDLFFIDKTKKMV